MEKQGPGMEGERDRESKGNGLAKKQGGICRETGLYGDQRGTAVWMAMRIVNNKKAVVPHLKPLARECILMY